MEEGWAGEWATFQRLGNGRFNVSTDGLTRAYQAA